jgi:hypothetical protein
MLRQIIKRAAVVTAVAGVTAAMMPAVSAQAINRVTSGCPRADYAKIWNHDSGVLCFANRGGMSVAIYRVNMAAGGNNTFRLTASTGTRYVVYPGQGLSFSTTLARVTYISID